MKQRKPSWPHIKEHALKYAVPAVLVGVAINQIWLAHTQLLTPWKGAGFGMFASVDSPGDRIVRGQFVIDNERYRIDLSSMLENLESHEHKTFINARAMPNQTGLANLGELFMAAVWAVQDDNVLTFVRWQPLEVDLSQGPLVLKDPSDHTSQVPVAEVELQVWKSTYSRQQQTIIPQPIATHTAFSRQGDSSN